MLFYTMTTQRALSKTEQAHSTHALNPSRRCRLCWEVARQAQRKLSAVTELDLMTLKLSIEEHVRPSYMTSLKRCVDAGLVVFTRDGVGAPVLTDAGRTALAGL